MSRKQIIAFWFLLIFSLNSSFGKTEDEISKIHAKRIFLDKTRWLYAYWNRSQSTEIDKGIRMEIATLVDQKSFRILEDAYDKRRNISDQLSRDFLVFEIGEMRQEKLKSTLKN